MAITIVARELVGFIWNIAAAPIQPRPDGPGDQLQPAVLRASSAVEGFREEELGPALSDACSQIEAAFRRTVIMV